MAKNISDFRKHLRDRFARVGGHEFWRYTPQMLMGLGIIVSTTLMFPSQKSYQFSHLSVGDVYLGDEIIAPFTFHIKKTEAEYERDKKRARENVPRVFVRVDSVERKALQNLGEFLARIESVHESVLPDSVKLRLLSDVLNDYAIIIEQEYLPFLLNRDSSKKSTGSSRQVRDEAYTKLSADSLDSQFDFGMLRDDLQRILTDVFTIGILNVTFDDVPAERARISLLTQGQELVTEASNFYGIENIETIILDEKLRQNYPQHEAAVKLGYAISTALVAPNLIYDEVQTVQRLDEAVAKVAIAKGTVLAEERIVDNHERITNEILEKLSSLASAKREVQLQEGGLKVLFPYVGKILIVVLALSFTAIFLLVSRRSIFEDVKQVLMIFIIMMLIIVFTFLVNELGVSSYKYLIPISIASMLLTIFFDTRVAFIATVTLSIIVGGLRGNEFDIMLVTLFVGTISIFSVREIQARSWLLKGLLFVSGAYIASIAALEFLRNPDFIDEVHLAYGLANGVLSPILTYGLMIIFEYCFKMTTDSTLLELSDLNKPLLRQLAIRAPGTHHHSIMVGNLSEAAAETISANALLARVASYYHDIGKMEMAEYFVENQKGGKNPHEKLSPNMSCLILINHVKRGVEIADEYGLPKEIRDIIPQHHGTNVIPFFYQKALENSDGIKVNQMDFRYPGPRPQTKEAGIIMLADGVEASSRTLKDPTISRIRNLVSTFIQDRLADAELDECPLTMQDLSLVKESFINSLTGIYHGRIEYPDRNRKIFGKKPVKAAEKVAESAA